MNKGNIFSVLSNEIREKIVRTLADEPCSFMELSRSVNASSSKLNFHLKKMKGILVTKENGRYHLTETGRIAYGILSNVELFQVAENEIKVASIGMVIKPNDIDFNVKRALENIDLMSSQGVSFTCLPFVSITQPTSIREIVPQFQDKAKDLGIYISFGFFQLEDEKRYHSTVLVKPDGNIEAYKCLHKNMVAHTETEVGDNIVVSHTKIGKIGLTCGNEFLYPELFRVLRLRGANYVTCPTFAISEKFRQLVHSILVARAVENQIIVALSASGFFKEETFAVVHSPYEEMKFSSSAEGISIRSVNLNDVQSGEEIFRNFFLGRVEPARELTVKKNELELDTALPFPIREVTRRYRVRSEDFVQIQEVTVFEKPLYLNIPVTRYCEGALPLKKMRDIKWFDNLGTLDGVITKKKPIVHFLVPNRLAITSGKFYSVGFQCKSSEPVEVKGSNIFLNLSFEDWNTFLSAGFELGKVTTELYIDPKFEAVKAIPSYSNVISLKTGKTFIWQWDKPREIPSLRIKLRKCD